MRAAIASLCLVASVAVVGACFDPTRTCSTNGDCVNGGTCDPGTKTCISGSNPNDKTPPVFSIAVVPPPARQSTGKLTELDPDSPDGGVDAFRRDESATVIVTSQDEDVDAGSVKLLVHGLSSSAVGTALLAQLGPCSPGTPGAARAFCRQATVALGSLPFDAFRGVMALEASGGDLSGNLGTADGGINVTRWKWRYSAGAPIYTTPAIADDGTIVFGTSDGGSGSLYALTPAGEERWPSVELGPIQASPVLGAADGGTQLAYVAVASPIERLFATDLGNGGAVALCPEGSGGYGGPFVGTPALVYSGVQLFEGALAVANGRKLVNIRPTASAADGKCLVSDMTASQAFPSSVVALGGEAYLGTAEGSVRAFTQLSGNWVTNTAWGAGLGYSAVGNTSVQLALIIPSIVGTTSARGAFSLDPSSGVLQRNSPDGGVQSEPGGLVLLGSQYVFGGGVTSSPSLFWIPLTLASGTSVDVTAPLVGTPIVGYGGVLYLATNRGTIESWASSSDVRWSGSIGSSESFLASPTIGCRSAGVVGLAQMGDLYIGSTSGNFFSVVVDSPGLDPTSLWPKYQHDIRNTGNPATPIQSCP